MSYRMPDRGFASFARLLRDYCAICAMQFGCLGAPRWSLSRGFWPRSPRMGPAAQRCIPWRRQSAMLYQAQPMLRPASATMWWLCQNDDDARSGDRSLHQSRCMWVPHLTWHQQICNTCRESDWSIDDDHSQDQQARPPARQRRRGWCGSHDPALPRPGAIPRRRLGGPQEEEGHPRSQDGLL